MAEAENKQSTKGQGGGSKTSFTLANEHFCFDTMTIRSILEYVEPTNVPLAKDYFLGVINNHGNMVPVIDMSKMFGIKNVGEHPEASIMIVSSEENIQNEVGFLVDQVEEVFPYTDEMVNNGVVLQIHNDFQHVLVQTLKYDEKFIYCIDLPALEKTILK